MSPSQLKKIVVGWHRLVLLSVFWVLAIVAAVFLVPPALAKPESSIAVLLTVSVMLILLIAAIVGTMRKTSWGRVVGIIAAIVTMLAFPIGTIIGLLGLWGYADAKPIFGPSGLAYSAVKAEILRLKA